MLRLLIGLLFFRSRGGERMGSRLFILEGPKMQRPYLPCMGRSTQFWWLPLLGFHFFCRETFGMTWIFPMHWQTGKIFGFAPIVVSAWNHVMVRVVVFLSTKCEQIRWKRPTEGTVCLCPVYFVHYSGSAIRTNAYWFNSDGNSHWQNDQRLMSRTWFTGQFTFFSWYQTISLQWSSLGFPP